MGKKNPPSASKPSPRGSNSNTTEAGRKPRNKAKGGTSSSRNGTNTNPDKAEEPGESTQKARQQQQQLLNIFRHAFADVLAFADVAAFEQLSNTYNAVDRALTCSEHFLYARAFVVAALPGLKCSINAVPTAA